MQITVESTMVIIEWQDVGGVQVKFGVGVGVWLSEVGEELGVCIGYGWRLRLSLGWSEVEMSWIEVGAEYEESVDKGAGLFKVY